MLRGAPMLLVDGWPERADMLSSHTTIITSIRHLCLNLFQQESSALSLAKKRERLRRVTPTGLKLCFQVLYAVTQFSWGL